MPALLTTETLRDRGFSFRQPPMIFIGYDPAGDGDDRDALVMLSREEWQKGEPHDPDFAVDTLFRVLAAQRMPRDAEFPDKIARLLAIHRNMNVWKSHGRCFGHFFCVETNGIGWAMASALRDKLGQQVISYVTVGNATEKPFEGGRVSMPRLAALDHLRVLIEVHRVKIARDAPGAKDLEHELGAFVWRRAGRPEAMEGQHDDLVMATCGAVWCAAKLVPPTLKAVSYQPRSRYSGTKALRG